MAKNKKYLPKTINWFRLPEYIKSIFEAKPDNTAELILAFDSEGEFVTIDKSTLGGGGGSDDQNASEVPYDNTASALISEDVQSAIDEVVLLSGGGITLTSELTNDGADATSTYVENDEIATVANSGSYNDLINLPTLGTAAAQNTTAFATAAQGVLADSSIQNQGTQNMAGDISLIVADNTVFNLINDDFYGLFFNASTVGGNFQIAYPGMVIQAKENEITLNQNDAAINATGGFSLVNKTYVDNAIAAGASGVTAITAGDGITVDNTIPAVPIISLGGTVELGTTGDPDELDLNFNFTDFNINLDLESNFIVNAQAGGGLLAVGNSGSIEAQSLTSAIINSTGNKSLITKEYADANYAGGGSTKYNQTFVIADWTTQQITILAATHGVGTKPIIQVFDSSGNEVIVDKNRNASGDVTLTVVSSFEFDGEITII